MFSNAITFIESRKDGVFIFVPEEKKMIGWEQQQQKNR